MIRFSDIFFVIFFTRSRGRVEMNRYGGGESRFSDVSIFLLFFLFLLPGKGRDEPLRWGREPFQ
jgi:hypothetical protein